MSQKCVNFFKPDLVSIISNISKSVGINKTILRNLNIVETLTNDIGHRRAHGLQGRVGQMTTPTRTRRAV